MATSIGPKIGIDGEAEYRKQINLIIQQAKTLASEMKLVTSEYTKNTDAEVKAARQSEVMQKQLDTQRERVRALTEMLEKSKRETGENSIETAKWQEVVNKAATELNKMENELDESADATDDLSDSIDDAEKSTFSFGDALKSNILSQAIVSGVKRLASFFSDIAKDAVGYNAQIEQYTRALSTALGDEQKAAETLAKIKEDAARTPYDVDALVQANQLLISTTHDADASRKTILALTDAISATGGGNDELTRMAQNLQQISNAGKATAQDIKQFAMAGIDIYGILSDYTGKSVKECQDLTVSYDLLSAALEAASSEGGRYFGANEQQAKTLNGKISTLKDNIRDGIGTALLGVNDVLKDVVDKALEFVDSADWQAVGERVSSGIKTVVDNGPLIISIVSGIGAAFATWNVVSLVTGLVNSIKAFQKANEGATIAQAALNLVMQANPIGIVITAIAALVAGLVTLFATNEEFRTSCIAVWTSVKDFVALAVNSMIAFGTKLKDVLVLFFTQTIPSAFNTFKEKAQSIFQSISQFFTNLAQSIKTGAVNIGTSIIDGIQQAVQFIKSLPGQALSWGRDFIQGFINGITSAMGSLVSTVSNAAGNVRSYWHFSRPDKGPLRDYETWMPDFVKGMAAGMRDNAYRLADAAEYLAGEIVIPDPDDWNPRGWPRLPRGPYGGAMAMGGITINVYGAPGQDVNELADILMDRIQTEIIQTEGVW